MALSRVKHFSYTVSSQLPRQQSSLKSSLREVTAGREQVLMGDDLFTVWPSPLVDLLEGFGEVR